MTWSKYLTAIRESQQRSSRNGANIASVILHHGATTSDEVMIQMMVTGSRQVSASAVVKDGRRTGVVNEDYRPWTTASAYWDGRSMTIECANESTDGWTISDASYESLAILLADWSIRYNFPLIRNGRNSTVFGHKEIYTYFGDSYATACPGGMDVDRVVRRANEIKAGTAGGGGTPIGEAEVKVYSGDAYKDTSKKTLAAGASARQRNKKGEAMNIVGEPGPYSLTLTTYASGKAGDQLDSLLVIQNAKTGAESEAVTNRLVVGKDGSIRDVSEHKITVPAGFRVFARVRAVSTNSAAVVVTRQDSAGYLFIK